MDLKKLFTPELIRNLGRTLYDGIIYPLAKAYVEKTESSWDDRMLLFLDGFVDDLLKEKQA